MIGGGGSFKSISVLLTGNNANLQSVLTQSAASVDAFGNRVQAANAKTVAAGKGLKAGLAAGALAAGAGLAYAVTQAVAFDKSMRNVNSLAGLGEKAFSQLEERVIGMSTRLPQSATTLAEGLYDIYSSGFQGADGMKILESAALSASAGLTTTEVSARAIAATLNAYGLQASDAADVSDVLFQTVNAGVISFDALAGNLGDVVGGAAAAKVSIDQVGSAIAAMTLAGIGGAEATTSLNSLLAKIIQPSDALSAKFKELGYESGAQALEVDGLRGVMEKLRVATGGNVTTLLELFPEIRAARGALALMANEGQNYANTAAQIEDKAGRAGATQKVFNEQMKAAGNQAQLLKNQVDAAAISVGLQLLPALVKGMDVLRDVGSAFGDLLSMLGQQFGPGLEDLGSILGDVFEILYDLGTTIWALVEPIASLGIGALAETFNLLMAAIEPITSVLAGNEAAVVALGVAIALYLVGGVGAAATMIGGNLVLALTGALNGLLTLQGGLAGARAAMAGFLASMGPILAVSLLVYGAVSAWQSYTEAVKETDDALASMAKARKSGTVGQLQTEVDDMEKLLDKREKLIEEYDVDGIEDVGKFFQNAFDPRRWGDVAALDEWKDSIDETSDAAEGGAADLEGFAAGITTLATSMGEIDPEKAARLMANLAAGDPKAITEIDQLLADMTPKLDEAGISSHYLQEALRAVTIGPDGTIDASSLDAVNAALRAAKAEAESAEGQQAALAEAFLATSEGAVSAADAADALKDALDGLTGASMGVDAAGIEWRAGLADLKTKLQDSEAGIKGNSLAAGENRLAIQDQIGSLQDLLVAQAENGDGAEKLTGTLKRGIGALVATGTAANIPAKAMRGLLRQYNLTPEMVKTLVEAAGVQKATGDLKGVGKQADNLGKKKPRIGVGVLTTEAYSDLKKTGTLADRLGLKKPKIKPETDSKKATGLLDTISQLADRVGEKSPKVNVSAPGAPETLTWLQRVAAAAQNKTVTITTVHKDVKKNADGGVWQASGPLPSQATMKPGSGGGLVQWAEGETGGEAFIPLGAGKRSRSIDILAQVASMFGYQLAEIQSYARGGRRGGPNSGIVAGPANSGIWTPGQGHGGGGNGGGQNSGGQSSGLAPFSFSYPDFKFEKFKFRKREKKETAEHYEREKKAARKKYEAEKKRAFAQWKKDKADALLQAEQAYQELEALYATSTGAAGTAGAFVPVAGSAGETMKALTDAREAQAQARAELAARQSANPYDTAEDFYQKPTVTIGDYIEALKASVTATDKWGQDLARISTVAGADVVSALQGMGEEGEAYIAQMATASVADMQAMADQLRRIQVSIFSQEMAQDIAAQTQFQGNLGALVSTGNATLAARFASMGYKDAGALAAAAVGMTPAERAALEGQVAQQGALSAGDITEAVTLAGLLQSSGGALGVVGLAAKSGKSIADVLNLLDRFDGTVFSRMPAPFIAQVRADQALLAQGAQPSGLQYGGIVPGSKTGDGLYYQWAESGTGGESLIPLGGQHRSRALDLWAATGRILGAGAAMGRGGSGSLVVMPGAVSVSVDASGQALTEGQVRNIASGAADKAMGQLADALATGKR